ncbi:MAG: Chloride channel protein EriC [Candidatus Methanohalarchaeum thermophilum]|uniref:Chloride channel protein EriC n=1 Tax=Methanohalarchaeum thermophilum TaxID=1903181 RepID=A0A1Q6DV84_METT1|nr:MAG: Chloride channel protein EriC [Candidatus Methanohalarchaeum thermophilum]
MKLALKWLNPENEEIKFNLIAVIVGAVAGLGAVLFRVVIWIFQEYLYGTNLDPGNIDFKPFSVTNLFDLLFFSGDLRFIIIPALGGLAAGVLIHYGSEEIERSGIPRVLESILLKNGDMKPKTGFYKLIASSISIASGHSVGREGPIVQIGSVTGSYFGKFMKPEYKRTFVAAGAAGGIAGTFNAPIAGIIFAIEVLLEEYYLKNIIGIVLGAATSTVIARSILQLSPAIGIRSFLVPVNYELVNPYLELPLYVVLGVLVTIMGVILIKTLYGIRKLFDRLNTPKLIKPAIGGILLGITVIVIGSLSRNPVLVVSDWLFGVGYSTVRMGILGDFSFLLLVSLGLLKILTVSFSLGSGNSGGIFSPALYIGAMTGAAFGTFSNQFFTQISQPGAYALVGMGGLYAAVASAPLTATLIIFELTGQYTIILPLLIVTVLGSEGVQKILRKGTIYTQDLRDKGITIQERRHFGNIEDLVARDVMTTDVDRLRDNSDLIDALEEFDGSEHTGLPLVDEENKVTGIITLQDVYKYRDQVFEGISTQKDLEKIKKINVREVGTCNVVTATPEEHLLSIIHKIESYDIGRTPVVDEDNKLIGIVSRSDILDAYDRIPPSLKIGREISK